MINFIKYSFIVLFLLFHYGCKSSYVVPLEEVQPNEVIQEIVYNDGNIVVFNEKGGTALNLPNRLVIPAVDDSGRDYNLEIAINHIKEIKLTPLETIPINSLTPQTKFKEILLKSGEIIDESFNPVVDLVHNYIKTTLKDSLGKTNPRNIPFAYIEEVRVGEAKLYNFKELLNGTKFNFYEIVSSNNRAYNVRNSVAEFQSSDVAIKGYPLNDNKLHTYSVNDILYVKVLRKDASKTTLACIGGGIVAAGVVVVIILASKQSCPFIYSYDGKNYVFDAEPLGGAITEGLERTEISRLDNIKPVDNTYKIKMTNEVDEVQYVNNLSLLTVDHPVNTVAVPDAQGNFYAVKPINPLLAFDEEGNNLNNFISKDDGVYWMTKKFASPEPVQDTRHHLTFSFDKPKDADNVNLVLNIGTSLWGSYMIKDMLLLRGNTVNDWYKNVNEGGVEKNLMDYYLEQEELYTIKIYVKEGNDWVVRGKINGGGPFISETRTVKLDITNVKNDKLEIRLNPPKTFWTLDYVAVDYNSVPITSEEIHFTKAVDEQENNAAELLQTNDKNYAVIPDKQKEYFLQFPAPDLKEKMERTVFAKSSGYYKINLPKTETNNLPLLYSTTMKRGEIINYSIRKQFETNKQVAALRK
ncbi:MAG TPA: hypothetical protein VFF33_09055 [Ignavibacteriaceae bacterium]|nr:hypothetical protein [Ignavibacteriaceae bacterium]